MLNKQVSWAIWFILLIPFLYLMNYTMPGVQLGIDDVADRPECAGLPDLSFGISTDKVYQELDCMGNQGRTVYKKESLLKDSIYPVSYGLFFAFTLFVLSSMTFRRKWPVVVVTTLPLIGMVFDFLENYQLRKLMDQFPELQLETVSMASIANIGKWSFIYASIAIVITLAIWIFIRIIGVIRKG